jgi:hypothetical protein
MEILTKILNEIDDRPMVKDFTPKIPYLEEENEVQRIKKIVIPQLANIELEIDNILFGEIRMAKNLEEAHYYFNLLNRIQEVLALLYYKENIIISDKLRRFISDFDRIDDVWLREKIFNKIKQQTYHYDVMRKLE